MITVITILPQWKIQKTELPSQSNRTLPECLRGPETIFKRIRHNSHVHTNKQPVHNPPTVDNLNTTTETEIVHTGRKTQNDCALNISVGNREQRALWDSDAGRCVISFDCYNRILPKYKTELFPSHVTIKAANGTIIPKSVTSHLK